LPQRRHAARMKVASLRRVAATTGLPPYSGIFVTSSSYLSHFGAAGVLLKK
jgi:hypothetical protein